jgi:hypothetical protein
VRREACLPICLPIGSTCTDQAVLRRTLTKLSSPAKRGRILADTERVTGGRPVGPHSGLVAGRCPQDVRSVDESDRIQHETPRA